MTNFYNSLFLNVFLILLVAGCATRPVPPQSPETFALRGKVAVREGEVRFGANLLWHQRGQDFEMDLWGPLGQGRVNLVKEGERIRLRTGDGQVTEGPADTLMRARLGWSLPLDTLPAWVRGEPLAGVPAEALARDAQGRITGFRQLGWDVALGGYRRVAQGVRDLPTRITATREAARIRLVVSGWRLGAGAEAVFAPARPPAGQGDPGGP